MADCSKDGRKFTIPAFIVGLVLSAFTVFAFASNVAESSPKYFSTYGHSYEGISYLSVDSAEHEVHASTSVQNRESKVVPSGYLAACARLYSGGYLQTATSWEYNDEPAIGIQISTDYFTTRATYYSQGQGGGFNGNDYDTYTLNRTPKLTN